jgi:hypothetical protein
MQAAPYATEQHMSRWDPMVLGQMSQWQDQNAMSQKQNEALFDQDINERNMALQNKYSMQQLQMQLEAQRQNQMMQMFAQGMALPSGEQIERSRGDLQTSLGDFAKMRDQGRYSQGEMDTLSADKWNKINQGSMQAAQDFNQQQAARGSFASPGAAAAMRMSGMFNANAARGQVQADLLRENKEAMERGTAGYADISGQMADFASRPINRMANFNPFTGEGMPPDWGGTDPNNPNNPRKQQKQPIAYGNHTPWTPRVAGGGY